MAGFLIAIIWIAIGMTLFSSISHCKNGLRAFGGLSERTFYFRPPFSWVFSCLPGRLKPTWPCASTGSPGTSPLPGPTAVCLTPAGFGPALLNPHNAHNPGDCGPGNVPDHCPTARPRSPTPPPGDSDALAEIPPSLPVVAGGLPPLLSWANTDASRSSPTPSGSRACETHDQTRPARSYPPNASVTSGSSGFAVGRV